MSTTNLDAYDLSIANLGGLIHEDVMNKIWDISNVPLPFTDRVGSESHENQYFEWGMDKLETPVTTGQVIDGSGGRTNQSKIGRRVGNQSEIRTKTLIVSTRADAVDTIGFARSMAYQVSQRQKELRRDVESTALSNNASVIGTSAVAGVTAGLDAWLVGLTDVDGDATTGNVNRGATGADGGWDDTDTDKLVAASTAGTTRAITEAGVRDVVQAIYEKGGEPSLMMTTPAVKRKFGEYLFSETAKVATMYSDKADSGAGSGARAAQGNVDVFLTDFGVLELVANRLQLNKDTDNATAFILDTSLVSMSYLYGYRTVPLATDGLYEKREVSVDWGLCVKNWDGLGSYTDVDPALAATA
jgi:hypothetical protein